MKLQWLKSPLFKLEALYLILTLLQWCTWLGIDIAQ